MKRTRLFKGVTVQVITPGGEHIPLDSFILSLENAIRSERQKVSRFADFIDKQGLTDEYRRYKAGKQANTFKVL